MVSHRALLRLPVLVLRQETGRFSIIIFSLSGETEFAKGWFLSGETLLQKGAHDKDISASVQFKRVW